MENVTQPQGVAIEPIVYPLNAGSWAKDNSPGMGGKDTQSGGKPEPLEVTNANKTPQPPKTKNVPTT